MYKYRHWSSMVAHLNMFMICALKITFPLHMLVLLLPGFSVLVTCPKRGCLHQAFSYTSKNYENMLNLEHRMWKSNGLLFNSFFFFLLDNWPHDGAIVPSYCKYRVWLWTGKRWREKRRFKVPNVNQLESRSWREWRK